ncbi:hypothetical protein [Luteolibacter luteus]|uniref:Uncharacterized protein n=1 Tax=Luteolibacter luteus TaxID=2728835 RepID=A0A858RMJ5_9BACT|nr:hypothetical protein [Luteolibacter luteus]QJE97203.1 hypothetical protein HHL09_15880 [Luteolibacter luteus]
MKLASTILVVIGLALMAAGVLAGGWVEGFSRWTSLEKAEPEDLLAP